MEHSKGASGGTIRVEDLLPAHLKASLQDSQKIGSDKKITVTLDKIDKEEIVLRCFSSPKYSSYHHTLLVCNTINEIFVGESTSDTDSVRVFLQALILVFGKSVLNAIRADLILDSAGLSLVLDELDPHNQETMRGLREDLETASCMDKIRVGDLPNPRIVAFALLRSYLIIDR